MDFMGTINGSNIKGNELLPSWGTSKDAPSSWEQEAFIGAGALRKAGKAFIICQENTKLKANTQVSASQAL